MQFDSQEHKDWLIAMLSNENIMVPLQDVELVASIKVAAKLAGVLHHAPSAMPAGLSPNGPPPLTGLPASVSPQRIRPLK